MIESRINNPSAISASRVRDILQAGGTPTIQFSEPFYTPALLREVNQLCVEFEDQLEVRFYGHYSTGLFDAQTLIHLPDVQWLSMDCLTAIRNEQEIGGLTKLTKLGFGVFEFDRADFLATLPLGGLRRLVLGENRKRNLDLTPLGGADGLRTLFLNGHAMHLEAIARLSKLSELSLSGMRKTRKFCFISELKSLHSLKLYLGSRESIDEVSHATLEELGIFRVRGLQRLGPLHRFPSLHRLAVEDQLQLRQIDVSGVPLQRLRLINCKKLEEIVGLDELRLLQEFRTARTSLDLDLLRDRPWPPSLRILALYKRSEAWNEATRRKLEGRGYREFTDWAG